MQVVNVQEVIDRQKVRLPHVIIVALCTSIMIMDGYDMYMIGAIAPVIAADFGEAPAAMMIVFLLQQTGIAIGAWVAGPIADRFGRKKILIVSTIVFSALMVLSTFAQSLFQLAVMRGLAGFFLSGVFPVASTLVSEFAPKTLRARFMTIILTGYVMGSAGGGAVAAYLVEDYGWRLSFWLGGILPMICLFLVIFVLPESVQYRANRNPRDPSIAKTLRFLAPHEKFDGDDIVFQTGETKQNESVARPLDVFTGRRLPFTICLWIVFMCAMGTGTLLGNWLPSFFHVMEGVEIEEFAHYLLLGSIAAVVSTLTVGILLDKLKPILVMTIWYFIYALALISLGVTPFGSLAFAAGFVVMSFCKYGGTAGLMALSASFYPSSMRATGLGWSVAAGRVGAILGPLWGGLALSAGMGLTEALMFISLPLFASVLGLIILSRLDGGGAPPAEPAPQAAT